jgi:hypothetical protein
VRVPEPQTPTLIPYWPNLSHHLLGTHPLPFKKGHLHFAGSSGYLSLSKNPPYTLAQASHDTPAPLSPGRRSGGNGAQSALAPDCV